MYFKKDGGIRKKKSQTFFKNTKSKTLKQTSLFKSQQKSACEGASVCFKNNKTKMPQQEIPLNSF